MKAIFGLIVVLLAAGPLFAEIDFNNMIRDSLKKSNLNASMSDILENQSPAAENHKNVILKQKLSVGLRYRSKRPRLNHELLVHSFRGFKRKCLKF